MRAAFVLALAAYAFALQFTSRDLASLDGYYHIRYAALLHEAGWRGFPPAFGALPLTLLSADRYFDHHMLFHFWLVPFAGGDLVLGAKIAAALGAAAAFASPYLLLCRQGVRHAHGWTIALLAVAPAFLYRMAMPRAQAWAVVFLVAGLALLFAERDAWLAPLGWLFAWSYNAFPALLALAACAVAARALLTRTWRPRPFVFALAGVVLGLLINPYFPASFAFVWHHFAGKLGGSAAPAGVEWNPFPVAEWVGWGGLAALLAAVAVLLVRRRAGLDTRRLTAVLAALLFLVLSWRWSRFVEYLVPLAGIAIALCLHEPVGDALRRLAPRRRRLVAAALVLWLAVSTMLAARQIGTRPPADRHRQASHWIAGHSSPAESWCSTPTGTTSPCSTSTTRATLT